VAKREKDVGIVGWDCVVEAVAEMKRKGSLVIGSISHEASSYGPALIVLGMALLRGQTVAPYSREGVSAAVRSAHSITVKL
jgi:ribose transport system substrate-binding protein